MASQRVLLLSISIALLTACSLERSPLVVSGELDAGLLDAPRRAADAPAERDAPAAFDAPPLEPDARPLEPDAGPADGGAVDPPDTGCEPSIVLDRATYAPGDTVRVTYACMPNERNQWFAIYRVSQTFDRAPAPARPQWEYGSGVGGSVNLTAPATSDEKFLVRGFRDNGYNAVAASDLFEVATP